MKIQDIQSTIRKVPSLTEHDQAVSLPRTPAQEKSVDGDSAVVRSDFRQSLSLSHSSSLSLDNIELTATRRNELLLKIKQGQYDSEAASEETIQKIREFYR